MGSNDSLILLGSLVRSLSHELRSPLSVLVNDLTYLKSRHPDDDLDRTLAQVEKISSLLKKISKIGDGALELKPYPLKEVLALAGLDTCGDTLVTVDRDAAVLALQWLVELLDSFSSGEKTAVQIDPGGLTISKALATGIRGEYLSLTEFFEDALKTSVSLAPLIDAIFGVQPIELKISSGDRIEVKLRFQ